MKTNEELQQLIKELTDERQALQLKVDMQGEELHHLKQRVSLLESENTKIKQTLKGRSYKATQSYTGAIKTTSKPEVKKKQPEVFRMKYYKKS